MHAQVVLQSEMERRHGGKAVVFLQYRAVIYSLVGGCSLIE